MEPLGQPEQLAQPVERQLLQLLQHGRGAPEDADLVERRDQQLGQDPGLRARVREVREVARALPVRDAVHELLVQVAQHGRERLRRLRRRGGSRERISPGATWASTGNSRSRSR